MTKSNEECHHGQPLNEVCSRYSSRCVLSRKSQILRLSCQPVPMSHRILFLVLTGNADWFCPLPRNCATDSCSVRCELKTGHQSPKFDFSPFSENFLSHLWCSKQVLHSQSVFHSVSQTDFAYMLHVVLFF
ncbi:hypothetical protein XENOCAPTIV_015896 [Xenoophorus captivus]|uniref:Uncharacterized protein n=1 Tax=Xenoophorus captivus TaxID=1517983 RepID=A0ABV0R925_9TELE